MKSSVLAFSELARELECDRSTEFDDLVRLLRCDAGCWFFDGQGRSRNVAAMVAMRMMHLDRHAHLVGDSTTPGICSEDHLVAISGSGQTPSLVGHAAVARDVDAEVIVVTRTPSSPLAALATELIVIRCGSSAQLGGNLFEQLALIVLDAAVTAAAGPPDVAAAMLAARHANLQ